MLPPDRGAFECELRQFAARRRSREQDDTALRAPFRIGLRLGSALRFVLKYFIYPPGRIPRPVVKQMLSGIAAVLNPQANRPASRAKRQRSKPSCQNAARSYAFGPRRTMCKPDYLRDGAASPLPSRPS